MMPRGFSFSLLQNGLYGTLEILGRYVVGFGIGVHEHRRATGKRHAFARCEEGEGRHEHGIVLRKVIRHQGNDQGIRSAGTGKGVLGARIGGQFLFHFGDLRAHDVTLAVQHLIDAFAHVRLYPLELSLQIYELHSVPSFVAYLNLSKARNSPQAFESTECRIAQKSRLRLVDRHKQDGRPTNRRLRAPSHRTQAGWTPRGSPHARRQKADTRDRYAARQKEASWMESRCGAAKVLRPDTMVSGITTKGSTVTHFFCAKKASR